MTRPSTRLRLALVCTILIVGALVAVILNRGPRPFPVSGDGLLDTLGQEIVCSDCNIVLVTLDTVRADFLSCYGYHRVTAPRICDVGQRGLLFQHAYSPAPWTLPALLAIFHGAAFDGDDGVALLVQYRKLPTLAEEMASAGLLTAGFTDHFSIVTNRDNPAMAELTRGFQTFVNVGTDTSARHSPDVTKAATDWIAGHRDSRFFLWAHYFDPHVSYSAPAEIEQKFGFDPATCGRVESGIPIERMRELAGGTDPAGQMTPRELECLAALYQAEIYYTDRHVGMLLDEIASLGLADRTLVVISADHGEEFMERSGVGHGQTVHDELIRVPLVVRHPRGRLRGLVTEPFTTMHLFHLLLAAAGRDRPITDHEVTSRTYFWALGHDQAGRPSIRWPANHYALIANGHKIIERRDRTELYDLEADPGERQNLEDAALRGRLSERLDGWRREHSVPPAPNSIEADEYIKQTIEALKGLGYFQ